MDTFLYGVSAILILLVPAGYFFGQSAKWREIAGTRFAEMRAAQTKADSLTAQLAGNQALIDSISRTNDMLVALEQKRFARIQTLEGMLDSQAAAHSAARQQFDGDLQLERQRYSDLVAEVLELVKPQARTAIQNNPTDTPPTNGLDPKIESAIEEFAGRDRAMRQYLEKRARGLLATGLDVKQVAKAIRQGDKVGVRSTEIPSEESTA